MSLLAHDRRRRKDNFLKINATRSNTVITDQVFYMQSKDLNEKHALTNSKDEKDLGIIVDSQLTFKNHISQSTTKANKILGALRRSFNHLTKVIQLYTRVGQPLLGRF